MLKLFFISTISFFVVACRQNSTTQNEKIIANTEKVDSFNLGDTTAIVNELIFYNRTHYTLLEKLPEYLKKFIKKGYAPLDTISADLNGDDIRDFLLATYKIGEDSLNPSPKRNLKILLGQQDGTYRLECESWEALASLDAGGFSDPYPGIVAKKGKFVIQFSGGSNWKRTSAITFEYSPVDMDWLQTQVITESYFMVKRHYESDTTTPKQFGRVTFKSNYCK
jgi:hypothetical protein